MIGPVGRTDQLDADADSTGVAVLDRLARCVEHVSLGFEGWADPHVKGPGLYFVVVSDDALDFVEPMGANRWPVEDCANVSDGGDTLFETARTVAVRCDGAVVVHDDGTIDPQMVRLEKPDAIARADLPFADWMGARHMSALETSARESVVSVVTLSEEDGRITVFTDGAFEDHELRAVVDD